MLNNIHFFCHYYTTNLYLFIDILTIYIRFTFFSFFIKFIPKLLFSNEIYFHMCCTILAMAHNTSLSILSVVFVKRIYEFLLVYTQRKGLAHTVCRKLKTNRLIIFYNLFLQLRFFYKFEHQTDKVKRSRH